MQVLVTGAAGFIGSHMVDHLVSRGLSTIALVHPDDDLCWLADKPVELAMADITDPESLRPVLRRRPDFIIHLAGVLPPQTPGTYYAVNTAGTANLVELCHQEVPNLRRLVMGSSLLAMGPCRHQGARTIGERCQPDNDYGRSKFEAEEIIRRYARSVPATIIRMGMVYGPRQSGTLFPLFKLASRGIRLQPAELLTNPIHVTDAVQALWRAAVVHSTVHQTYLLAGPTSCTFSELAVAIERSLGVRTRTIRLNQWLVRLLDAIVSLHARLRRCAPLIELTRFRDFESANYLCDLTRLQDEFGFYPSIDLEEGIRQTALWYRQAGWLGV